jgi:hypothetical protein
MATALFSHRFHGGVSLSGPASYAAGGFACDNAAILGRSRDPSLVLVDTDSTTYGARFDLAAKKVVAIVRATGAQVADAVNLSTVTFYVLSHYDK